MPTRNVESEHDEVHHSSTDGTRATAEAEPNHPVPEKGTAGVESPIAEEMQGASSLPRQSSADGATAGLPHDTNADDTEPGKGDQDIDTAGTEADEQSVVHHALGFPRSNGTPGPPKLGPPSDGGSPAKVL